MGRIPRRECKSFHHTPRAEFRFRFRVQDLGFRVQGLGAAQTAVIEMQRGL